MRLTTLLLCLILAAAAAGRYKAEDEVRDARSEVRELDAKKARELSSIQVLRAEVAFLERPERLAEIAESVSGLERDLEPLTGAQLMTAEDFELAFAIAAERRQKPGEAAGPLPSAVTVAGLDR